MAKSNSLRPSFKLETGTTPNKRLLKKMSNSPDKKRAKYAIMQNTLRGLRKTAKQATGKSTAAINPV